MGIPAAPSALSEGSFASASFAESGPSAMLRCSVGPFTAAIDSNVSVFYTLGTRTALQHCWHTLLGTTVIPLCRRLSQSPTGRRVQRTGRRHRTTPNRKTTTREYNIQPQPGLGTQHRFMRRTHRACARSCVAVLVVGHGGGGQTGIGAVARCELSTQECQSLLHRRVVRIEVRRTLQHSTTRCNTHWKTAQHSANAMRLCVGRD